MQAPVSVWFSVPSALASPAAAATSGPTSDPGIHFSTRHAAPGATVSVSSTACGSETYGKGESEAGGKFHLLAGRPRGRIDRRNSRCRAAPRPVLHRHPEVPAPSQSDGYVPVGTGNPSGAVDAGFGAGNDNGTQLALGAVLLAGAVAGGVIKMRRRPAAART